MGAVKLHIEKYTREERKYVGGGTELILNGRKSQLFLSYFSGMRWFVLGAWWSAESLRRWATFSRKGIFLKIA